MLNRRAAVREFVNEAGLIAVDEHSSIGCMIYDRSSQGVRLTMPDTAGVPELFLLTSTSDVLRVCRTVWRTTEEIGATFAS